MTKRDSWFVIPLVEENKDSVPDGFDPGKRPKYVNNVGSYNSQAIPDSNKALVLIEADESRLKEISEKDDVETLSEIQAQKLHLEINKNKDKNQFRPVSPGEGDTPEERLNDVISKLKESMFVGDENVTVAEPTIEVGDKLFLQQPIHLLDFENFIELPRQFFDLLLQPPVPVIPIEQREYLDTSSNFIQYSMKETNIFQSFDQSDLLDGPGFKGLMMDFNSMIEHILIYDRIGGADKRVKKFIQSYTGLSGASSILTTFGIFGPTSLALLDGIIKYRCPKISLDEGNYTDGVIEMTWRPDNPEESSMNYHDRLQYWREYVVGDDVKSVIDKIDDLDRYNLNNLRLLAGIMGNSQVLERELNSTGHFLAVLSEQRNFSIHGQGSSRIIAPLALNLCILVLLDAVGNDDFNELNDQYLQERRR